MDVPRYTVKELNRKKCKYSLCIPVYNEGERIIKEIERAANAKVQESVDIILIDGGSTDGSIEKIDKSAVNSILYMHDKGIYRQSQALQAGFDYSLNRGYKGIITVDGNNKDGIEMTNSFVQKLEMGYDYIQGSRFLQGGKETNTPYARYLAIKLIHSKWISILCHKKYTDTTNLFRGYSKKYLLDERVQPFRKIFKSYELSTYLSTRADRLGLKTCEIPVERNYPSRKKYSTKVGKIKGNLIIIKCLIENTFGKYNP